MTELEREANECKGDTRYGTVCFAACEAKLTYSRGSRAQSA